MGGNYHVVCHECPEERVLDERDAARDARAAHEEETGHRVSCEAIDPAVPDA